MYYAINVNDFLRVHADEVTKEDGPFFCEETLEDVVHRNCIEKSNHFASKPKYSKTANSPESKLHKDCKEEICYALQKQFPNGKWENERMFPAIPKKDMSALKADISGFYRTKKVVIEVQASALPITTIIHRTIEYAKRNTPILWVLPVYRHLLSDESFTPRLFERYLHSMYSGRVYYWASGDGCQLKTVHFDATYKYIEHTEWYDVDAEELKTAGGYDKRYKRRKTPNFGPDFDVSNDSIVLNTKEEYEMENYTIPKCLLLRDSVFKGWWKNDDD